MMLATTGEFWPGLALWLVLACAVAMSALFSALETGLYVLNKARLELDADGGRAPARRLRELLQNPNNLLAVLLVGANLSEYAASFAGSAMLVFWGWHDVHLYTLAVATPLLFVLGQSVPKNLAQRLGERLMYPLSRALRVSVVVLNALGLALAVRGLAGLIRRLVGGPTRRWPLGHEVFSTLLAEGQASGVLTHFQSIMADRIMHIQQVRLGDVMIPLARVVGARQDIGRPELLELVRRNEYSRLPLLDASGSVVGVLDVYDILQSAPEAPPASLATAPLALEAGLGVTDALYQMQRARKAMAVVRAPGGRHLGIATVKDIVEEIVGELEAW